MEQRVAAIDIGTYSVKMTIAGPGGTFADRVVVTHLGEGVASAGKLDPSAKQRTCEALAGFRAIATQAGVQRIAAVGTSALRDASDGPEFAERIAALLGGPVEILSGDREASLVFRAVADDPVFGLRHCSNWILTDVGGGSTEVVSGSDQGFTCRLSLPLGAVRLTEDAGLGGDDPVDSTRFDSALETVDRILESFPGVGSVSALVASGGPATSLAAVKHGRFTADLVHGTELTVDFLRETAYRLASLPLEQRRAIAGIDPARAPVMVAGALIQWRSAVCFGAGSVRVSARGLRYGLLAEMSEEPETRD